MSVNDEVAEILLGIADLLELQNERFKPEAYRRAARSIGGAGADLRSLRSDGLLGEIPGVGKAIQQKIEEFLDTGSIAYYERLKSQTPAGVLQLMHAPGIGPKTAARFYRELGIDSPASLRAAIDRGRLAGVAGFGPRKIGNLRRAVANAGPSSGGRLSLRAAWKLADGLARAIGSLPSVDRIEVAGSLRRRRETVGDVDLLATSSAPKAAISAFAKLAEVRQVLLQGETKCTVIVEPGIQVDLRVVAPESFGAALQYFTGSKDHNVRLRTWARDRGLKINEYGVFRGDVRIAGENEEEVYRSLGLPWIPPEIRENRGELDLARKGVVPPLVAASDLQGEVHRHLSTGPLSDQLAAIAEQSIQRQLAYIGVVLDNVRGSAMVPEAARSVRAAWESMRLPERPVLRIGYEVAIEAVPEIPELPAGVDYLVASASPDPPGRSLPPSWHGPAVRPWFVGHLGLSETPIEAVGEAGSAWVRWASAERVALEITPDAPVDGMDSASIRRAVEEGVFLVVSAAANPTGALSDLDLAVGVARRGWAPAELVLNARTEPDTGPPVQRARRRRSKPGTGA